MKSLLLCLISFIPFVHADDPKPAAGTQVAQKFTLTKADGSKNSLNYLLYLPKTATADTKEKFPFILFLHGSGERGDNLEDVKKHGPPGLIGKNADMDSCIIVSPQCPANQWWDVKTLKALCDDVASHQPVDSNRRYLTGLSMGGFGSWDLLAAYPDDWAAAVPICGGGKPETVGKFKAVPIWVFHGAKDPAVPLKNSEVMVEALKAAGASPKFTVYPEEGHRSWIPAYNDAALWKWLLKQKKGA